MTEKSILYTKENRIGIVTFNRPENRNSMDSETLTDFMHALDQIRKDPDLRCLIITGSGNTFCGGADLRNSLVTDGSPITPDRLMGFYSAFLGAGQLSIPVIAAVNGHAIGGGFGLALLCDMRVVNKDARLGANFARLGIHCGMAVSYILPRLVGLARASELLFTGRIFTGETAHEIGISNYTVPEDKVLETALKLAREIAESAPVAVQMMKKTIQRGLNWDPVGAAELEALSQSHTFAMADSKEGIQALLEKRPPDFKGE